MSVQDIYEVPPPLNKGCTPPPKLIEKLVRIVVLFWLLMSQQHSLGLHFWGYTCLFNSIN